MNAEQEPQGPGPQQPQRSSDEELRHHVERMAAAGVSDDKIKQFIKDYAGTPPPAANFGDVEGGSASAQVKPSLATRIGRAAVAVPMAAQTSLLPGMDLATAATTSAASHLTQFLPKKLGGGPPLSIAQAHEDIQRRLNRDLEPHVRSGIQTAAGAAALAAAPEAAIPKLVRPLVGGLEKVKLATPATWAPWKTGALVGGADQALSADPINDKGDLAWRALKTGVGTTFGAMLGDLMEKGATAVRMLRAPPLEANILARKAERAMEGARMYRDALEQGRGRQVPKEVREFLAEPQVAERVAALREEEKFKNIPVESPEFLDGLSKVFSDEAKSIAKGQAVASPGKPNTGRFRGQTVEALKERLHRALGRNQSPLVEEVPATMHGAEPVVVNEGREPMLGPGAEKAKYMNVPKGVHEVDPLTISGREQMSGPVSESPLAAYTTAPTPHLTVREALAQWPQQHLPGPAVQGPGGPQFQLRARPERTVPGVRIETPAMRVQTAAERPPNFQLAGQPRKVTPGVEIGAPSSFWESGTALTGDVGKLPSMRIQTAPEGSAFMDKLADAERYWAQRSGEIRAIGTGMDAARAPVRPSFLQLNAKEPKTTGAFSEWTKNASDEELQAAREGILGDLVNAWKEKADPNRRLSRAIWDRGTVKKTREVLSKAAPLLRATGGETQFRTDLAIRLGLGGANTPSPYFQGVLDKLLGTRGE